MAADSELVKLDANDRAKLVAFFDFFYRQENTSLLAAQRFAQSHVRDVSFHLTHTNIAEKSLQKARVLFEYEDYDLAITAAVRIIDKHLRPIVLREWGLNYSKYEHRYPKKMSSYPSFKEILDIAVFSGLIKDIPIEDLINTRNIAVHQPERIDQAMASNFINLSAQILSQLPQSTISSNDINKNENEKT